MKTIALLFLMLIASPAAAFDERSFWTGFAAELQKGRSAPTTRSWEVKPSLPTGGDDDMRPGGYLNPLKIEQDGSGEIRIRSSLPAGDVMAPGGYLNPYVIK